MMKIIFPESNVISRMNKSSYLRNHHATIFLLYWNNAKLKSYSKEKEIFIEQENFKGIMMSQIFYWVVFFQWTTTLMEKC